MAALDLGGLAPPGRRPSLECRPVRSRRRATGKHAPLLGTSEFVHGASATAQCTIEMDHVDFMTMLGDPNAGMQLYFAGKLRVSGDPMLAMKLQGLFALANG